MAHLDPFFVGKDGVGGVTEWRHIKLYLEDTETKQGDVFMRAFRNNMVPLSHEFCHAILIFLGRDDRVALRNDDFGGNKKGKILNFSTAEVHDRHTEGKFWALRFWFWDWILWRSKRMYCRVLDIRDLT